MAEPDVYGLHDILKHFQIGMLVTRSAGTLRGRPMAVVNLEAHDDVWFVTSLDSGKAKEIEGDPHVLVAFQDSSRYVSLAGTAEFSRDRALVDKFWNESWKVWFPKGKDDPELTLLKVNAQTGEFWDMHGATGLRYLWEATKAYFQGEKPKSLPGVHAEVRL